MLHVVTSLRNGRNGVVDDTNGKLIVPLDYSNITLQKYGIIAEQGNSYSDAFSLTGTPLFKNGKNMVFLENNLIIASSANDYCFILDYVEKTIILKLPIDALLFFYGSKNQAEIYEPTRTFTKNYFFDSDYLKYGAHVEDLICCRLKSTHKWGVFDAKNSKVFESFNHNALVQMSNSKIIVRGPDGEPKWLI